MNQRPIVPGDFIAMKEWQVYVLELVQSKFYVGISTNPTDRFQKHLGKIKGGAAFTKEYKPLRILEIINTKTTSHNKARKIEDTITVGYMKLFGIDNVRGGRFTGSVFGVRKRAERELKKRGIEVVQNDN